MSEESTLMDAFLADIPDDGFVDPEATSTIPGEAEEPAEPEDSPEAKPESDQRPEEVNDPEVPTEPVTPAVKDPAGGLIADLQAERQRRQQLEAEVAAFKATGQAPKDSEPDALDIASMDAEEILTAGQVRQVIAAEVSRALHHTQVQSSFEQSEVAAKTKFSAETMGPGMDFDTVVSTGMKNLTDGDRFNIRTAPQRGEDPATEFYKLCIARTPELRAKIKTAATAPPAKTKPPLTGPTPHEELITGKDPVLSLLLGD
jgi:hypothetical protein